MVSSLFANQPWHNEMDFESRTRIMVGETDTDDVDNTVWTALREDAEAEILASINNMQGKPLRDMLNRVPGELIPQFGCITAAASNYTYTILLPSMINTPIIWKNLTGLWKNRFDTDPLIVTTDYTVNGNTVTINSVEKGDIYCIEYETTLNPVPPLLKKLSVMKTSGNIILAKYGTEHARAQAWAQQYGEQIARTLDLLSQNKVEIPELARINLFNDWKEDTSQGVESILMLRA
jgi:hypothetical protein